MVLRAPAIDERGQGVVGKFDVFFRKTQEPGLFQLADGVQAVAAGALRGLKDTAVPMLLMGFGYWVAGLPIGLLLAFPGGLGPLGLWIGLAVGLFLVAGLMLRRWMRLSARPGMMRR